MLQLLFRFHVQSLSVGKYYSNGPKQFVYSGQKLAERRRSLSQVDKIGLSQVVKLVSGTKSL